MLLVLPGELEILRDMRPIDRDVFYYLAERVDYDSGVIGRTRRVSYGGMALDLSERDFSRRVKETLIQHTITNVENSVKRLVKAGLLEKLSKSGVGCSLVLSRVYWVSVYSSVKNPVAAQLLGQLLGTNTNISNNINTLDNKNKSSCQSKLDPVATTSIYSINNHACEEFVMSLDWQYSENELQMILHRAGGFKLDQVKPEWVSGFVGYWWGQGDKKRLTQQQWTAKLGANLVNYLRNPGTFENLQGGSAKAAIASPDSVHYPDWARLPRDDQQLVSWMRRMGYGDPPPGLDFKQARAFVQRRVDIRLSEWKRGLS